MSIDSEFENVVRRSLYKGLSKLNIVQFKMFYAIVVHYWADYRYFISEQNFLNLWCELNQLCHKLDESFPDPYDDHEKIKSFCQTYPYYFIDKLPIHMISDLFATYVDDHIDVLTHIVKILYEIDLKTAYAYANKTLKLNEPIDSLVTETQDHIAALLLEMQEFSWWIGTLPDSPVHDNYQQVYTLIQALIKHYLDKPIDRQQIETLIDEIE